MRVTYNEDKTVAYFDGFKFRRDAKTGYFLSTKVTSQGKRERLHVYVWRYNNGAIPEGCHIHHVDEDKYHNDIENLVCIGQSEHLSIHSRERVENDREKVVENLTKKAIPAAAAWHKSEAGREWHRKNWQSSLGKIKPATFKCQWCGRTFVSLQAKSKFCSNNCKTKARKNSGVDNEVRTCKVCGKEFVCDKYAPTKTCSKECGTALSWDSRHSNVRRRTGLQHGSRELP